MVNEVRDADLDACKIFINRGKGARGRYFLFPASYRLVPQKVTPCRAIDT
jgi:hypothetical protein